MRRNRRTIGLVALMFGLAIQNCRADPACMSSNDVTRKGINQFYCVAPQMISEESYCLRQKGDDPKHVRGLRFAQGAFPEGLMTQVPGTTPTPGKATMDDPVYPTGGPCGKNPQDVIRFANKGDLITVLPVDQKLLLNITNKDGQPTKYFQRALELKPDPAGGHFYWTATTDDNEVDFFVMMADDKKKAMGQNDESRVPWIERYLFIEAFYHDQSRLPQCSARRPDRPAGGAVSFNFYLWEKGRDSCNGPGSFHENGSGSGGHDIP